LTQPKLFEYVIKVQFICRMDVELQEE
jgi:hypothetical protein